MRSRYTVSTLLVLTAIILGLWFFFRGIGTSKRDAYSTREWQGSAVSPRDDSLKTQTRGIAENQGIERKSPNNSKARQEKISLFDTRASSSIRHLLSSPLFSKLATDDRQELFTRFIAATLERYDVELETSVVVNQEEMTATFDIPAFQERGQQIRREFEQSASEILSDFPESELMSEELLKALDIVNLNFGRHPQRILVEVRQSGDSLMVRSVRTTFIPDSESGLVGPLEYLSEYRAPKIYDLTYYKRNLPFVLNR